jgi:hypothetical protein
MEGNATSDQRCLQIDEASVGTRQAGVIPQERERWLCPNLLARPVSPSLSLSQPAKARKSLLSHSLFPFSPLCVCDCAGLSPACSGMLAMHILWIWLGCVSALSARIFSPEALSVPLDLGCLERDPAAAAAAASSWNRFRTPTRSRWEKTRCAGPLPCSGRL